MAKRWMVAPGDESATRAVGEELGLHPLAARVLVNRGFREAAAADRFLRADLTDLPDPFLMRGMDRAVERLVRAIDSRESVCCYGDYDVDGVTSTALLASFLEQAGANVRFVVDAAVDKQGTAASHSAVRVKVTETHA